ncbi:hypothetical protein Tco_1012566 [Tanacetum coccineum]
MVVGAGCNGGGEEVMMKTKWWPALWLPEVGLAARRWRCMAASECGDRTDRVMGSVFGFGRKSPPENFSGGGGVVAGGWPEMGRERGEGVRKMMYSVAEGSMQQHDLTVLVNKLNDKIDGLEKDLQQTKKTYSTALTKLVLRVKKLEFKLKSGKARRKAKIEEEVHEKPSDETEVLIQEETPTEIIKEHESGEKGEIKISTANIHVSTASPPKVSTAVPHVYTRRSAKDKGKAIMEEPATPKKVKKRTQVQLSMDEELARKTEEEERIRFNAEQEARALQEEEEERLSMEAARELQRQLDQRHEVPTQPTQSQGIDWNDLSGLKVEKDSSKPSERETSKTIEEEKVEEENVNPEPVLIEKKAVGIRIKTLARRRASDKQGQDSLKKQKKEKETADFEEEKDELRMWLTVVPDEEEFVDLEIMHTKLVMERFQDNTPEGYNLMLWGDLKILVDPEQDDDIWKNQNQ